jgi:aspartate racemase
MDDLQIRLEKLSPEKRALVIKQLQRKKLAASASMPKISQREDTKTHPLSYAQQRMWFLNQWEPENPFYNITAAVRISGLLDPTVFSRSINEIIRRHEVLRARFVIGEDGYPIQEIADQVEVLISELDLTSFVGKKQDQELQRLMVEEAKKPFDLTVGPLIRINLIRLNANEYVVLLTIHHIVADGWSVDIFIREVATLYEAYSQGKRSPFAELSIQFADFAEWQRDWLQEDALEHQLDFWKQVYQSIPDPLELPLDRPRPVVQTFNGAVETLYMGRDIVDAIKELGQNRNTSIFMTLLAAFYVLLYRYSGQDDICIGSPVSNRNRTEIEGLIGLFVNTLALRADLSGGLTFLELLDQVRDITLGAYDYQDLPFEILFDALDIERDLSRTPLFQVMFALQEAPLENLRLPTIELNQVDVDTGTSKFDLTLFLEENSRGLKAMMEYNTDLFDAETISRMLNHFRMILRGIVQNPQRQLSLLPILTDEEFSLIINTWNDTATDYPRDKNIGQLFEIQVSKTPENIAITFGDEQLIYHELNQRANQLARYLQSLGVGPEILVGIYMERSIEMVVATLGIVKAGGAYMPLDTEYPTERLAFMLSDGHVSVVISDTDNLSNLADTIEHVINIGTDWKYISNHKSDNLPLTTCADNLLYVMYTSGSTGTPKGVSVTHRGVGRLVKEVSFARISQDDVFLQLAPISFDAATLEIWGPLLNGGRLVVAPPHKLTMDEIAKLLAKHQITTLWLTSSLFHIMVENHLEEIGQLDQLLAGGDVLSVSHVVNVIQAYPKIKMTNGYGPTENTTFSTTYQILDLDKISNTVPIGKPISNSKAYILDKDLQPVPIGVIGELFVGGDGLARNYINRPGLTAARFLPNPYSGIPGDRFYRTGDLSRLRSDGTIEFN